MAERVAISFFGAAQQVTGACYQVELGEKKILIDCGLVQGGRFCESHNGEPFGFEPSKIEAVFVTHAHLDHVGRIPRLLKEGFRGTIYSTAPTKDLAELLLRDGYGIMQKEAVECAQEIIYEERHIDDAVAAWKTIEYGASIAISGAEVSFLRAGHILGSAMALITVEDKKILFSGDIGTNESILLPPSDPVSGITHLVLESTYGNKLHEDLRDRELTLERAVEENAARRGTLMIPAFATERTQDIIFELNEQVVQRRVPEMPVFVDSPLAIKVTEVFERYRDFYNDRIKTLYEQHPHLFKSKALKMTTTVEESKAINDVPPPKVIIAGSGMMTGGRILHHLRRYLPDENSTLMVTGYQARGSLGRHILEGAREVRLFGETIPVRANIIPALGYSAHGDRERLYTFVADLRETLRQVFAVHGEAEAASAFVTEVRDKLGIAAQAPAKGDSFEIS